MKVVVNLFKSVMFALVCIPSILIVYFSFLLSSTKTMTIKPAYDLVMNSVSRHLCLNQQADADMISCVLNSNIDLVKLTSAIAIVFFVYSFIREKINAVFVGRKITSNVSFFALILPILYYVVIYLPSSWDANDPLAFAFMFTIIVAHIFAISIVQGAYAILFNRQSLSAE